ncbi:hypothetical protein RJ639_015366 [Escallonia herrerae]|uniref:Peptidase A1 domain-containing protein n=1 Tax=Escallonia herrerae TaxID=1293975 RepID=A0AA88VFY6_9ASTE|nr:hypothetical protein RJ639_015366 [Escallonia herrerae]
MEIASLFVLHARYLPLILAFLIYAATTTITSSAATTTAAKKPLRLVTKLIHRDSILSPYYNASDPPVPQLVVMDTGSSLFWIIGFYYLTLQGTSFEGRKLEIDPQVIQRNEEGDGGVIIDSGRTITSLVRDAFQPLKDEVADYIDGLKLEKVSELPLCYKGIVSQDLKDFPKVTFHFSGADLDLSAANMFHMIDVDTFCLFVEPLNGDTPGGASMIGVVLQQYFNVAYDLKEKTLSFLSFSQFLGSIDKN